MNGTRGLLRRRNGHRWMSKGRLLRSIHTYMPLTISIEELISATNLAAVHTSAKGGKILLTYRFHDEALTCGGNIRGAFGSKYPRVYVERATRKIWQRRTVRKNWPRWRHTRWQCHKRRWRLILWRGRFGLRTASCFK